MTVFVTTHYMDEAEYCDRLGLIYRGELIALGTPHALKTEIDARRRAGGRVRRGGRRRSWTLEKLPTVKEAALFGKGLHVVAHRRRTGDGRGSPAALAERGTALERIEKIMPSLEDVFVSLIEARDRAEQPQAEVRR